MESNNEKYLSLEPVILDIVRELLYDPTIARDTDLFEAGLNSIMATQMMSKIQAVTGIELGLHEIFDQLESDVFNVRALARITALSKLPSQQFDIVILPQQSFYELSYVQKRLWLLEKFNGGEHPSSIPIQIIFRESVNPLFLQQALVTLVERHESLRTFYFEDQDDVKQGIYPAFEVSVDLPFEDASNGRVADANSYIKSVALEEARHIFDLSRDLLLKARLVKTSNESFHLFVTVHHIASDGWSTSILLNELLQIYDCLVAGQTPKLPMLTVQYKDYAAWFNQRKDEKFIENASYWNEHLTGDLPRITLPAYRDRPAIKSYDGKRKAFVFNRSVTDGLKKLSHENDATLFNTLIALLNVLFYRYTGHGTITMGTSVANRTNAELQNLVGYFLSVVPLKSTITEEDAFVDVLNETKRNWLAALKHQEYPFDQLVKDIDKERDLSYSPIFDVVVLLHNYENPITPEGIECHPTAKRCILETDNQTCIVDLFLEFFQHENDLTLNIRYDTKIYTEAQIDLFFSHLKNLAVLVCESVSMKIDRYDFLTEKERLRYQIPTRPATTRLSVIEQFEQSLRKFPNKTAVKFGSESVSYRELSRTVQQVYTCLINTNKNLHGEIVCVSLDRSPTFIACLLAIWKAGAVYVPIDPDIPVSRFQTILDDTNCRVLLSSKANKHKVHFGGASIFVEDISAISHNHGDTANVGIDDIAYIIYTSGSTGIPKGAIVAHRGMLNHLDSKISSLSITHESVVAQNASQTFDISIWQMIAPLLVGATTVIIDHREILQPQEFIAKVATSKVSHLEVVPSYLAALLDHIEASQLSIEFPALHYLLVTGETLLAHLTHRWLSMFPSVSMVNAYGPTEASDDVTHHFINAPVNGRVPIGQPILHTQIYVLNEHLGVCPEGTVGELYVAGEGVGYGYLNDPTKTNASFIKLGDADGGKLYKTGDLGRYLPDGTIEFYGRKDQQIKLFGHRIELGEIESKISKVINPDMIAVILCQEPPNIQYLVAFIQKAEEFDELLVKAELRTFLPEYMIPSSIIPIQKMPLTANGKIDKKALYAVSQGKAEEEHHFPATETERILKDIWCRVLKLEDMSVTRDFFKAGGSSLLANQIVLKVHQQFGVRLELRDVFTYCSIRSLANRIKDGETSAISRIPVVEEQDYYSMSHSQKRMWILNQVKHDQIAYNVHGSYLIDGRVDVSKLLKAIEHVANNHEALRTTFPVVGTTPVQKILPVYPVAQVVKIVNRESPVERHDEIIGKELNVLLKQPFNLEHDILFRVNIIVLSKSRVAILMVLHHIISDGWSRGIIEEELFETYERLLANISAPPAAGAQYRDYSAWQNDLVARQQLDVHKAYWKKQIGTDEINEIELPSSGKRPEVQTFNGSSYEVTIPAGVKRDLYSYFQKQEVTTFMGLISTLFVYVHKLTGQNNIILGATLAGRNHVDLEKVVGFFVNALPLKFNISNDHSFSSVVPAIKELVLEMLAHEAYPFDLMIDDLNITRDLSRNALFDILVEVHEFDKVNSPLARFSGDAREFRVSEIQIPEVTSIYDLNIVLKESADALKVHFRYNSDLFTEDQIIEFAAYFEVLSRALINNDRTSVSNLPPFQQASSIQATSPHNTTEDPTVLDLVLNASESFADKTAVSYNNTAITYKELIHSTQQFSNFLNHIGHAGNPIVGILMDRSDKMVVSILSLWASGKAYLPMEGATPLDRLIYIVNDASLQTLIFSKKYLREAQTLQWACPSLETIICIDSENIFAEPEPINESMKKELWEYVGTESTDDITGGGWTSSYTGKPLSRAEMDEYAANALHKLKPYLHPNSKVLEIGCASGISMFTIAPNVLKYVGTDLSNVIIEKNRLRIAREGISNIEVFALHAHEIEQLAEGDFDVVIINSVVQNFNGLNYLREVIEKSILKMRKNGILFIGDVMDLGRKSHLIKSLTDFCYEHDSKFPTKLDWDDELFVHQDFFTNLAGERDAIARVEISNKIFTIANELTDFRFDAIIHIDKSIKKKGDLRCKKIFDLSDIERQAKNVFQNLCRIEDIAYVIYTSGSTGNPKGAIIENRGMSNHLLAKVQELQLNSNTILAQNASHCFDISVWQFFAALTTGGKVIIYDKDTVINCEQFLKQLQEDRVTILEVVPTYLSEIVDVANENNNSGWAASLEYLVVTGEALHKKLVARWFEHYPTIKLVNAYGPTEASDDVTHHIMSEAPKTEDVPIGKALREFSIRIVDKNGQVCPAGIKGELWVTGKGVGRGYLNNPEKTHASFLNLSDKNFHQRVYKTGDIAKFNLDGTLSFAGREDFQVKVRGNRIELGEIEHQLLQLPGVREAAVIVNSKHDGESSLDAFISMVEGSDLSNETIRRKLSRVVPGYMLPDTIHIMERLPVNSNGKIDRKKLLAYLASSTVADFSAATDIERRLLDIWQNILGRAVPSPDSNFFEIGGHSLKATRMVSAIHKEFNVKVNLRDIFLQPTIRQIAANIQNPTSKQYFQRIPVAPKQSSYELSSSQKRLWVLSQFEGGMRAYCENGAIILNAQIDVPSFMKAVDALVNRHESLRTTFGLVDGDPRQIVHPHVKGQNAVKYIDHVHLPFDIEAFFDDFSARAENKFDLVNGPLIRFFLVRTASDSYAFLFSAHHIICDGWSGRVFLKDLLQYYFFFTGKSNVAPKALSIQYKDYALWQASLLRTNEVLTHRNFWLNTLGGTLPKLDPPTAFGRPPVFTHAGETLQYRFKPTTYKALKALSLREDASLFMTLVSVLNLLFFRYTGQTEMVFGTSVSGREHTDLEDQIGFFLNTLALRNKFESDISFSSLLAIVKRNTLAAFEHQQYPFDLVVEDLKPRRDLSRSPIFDVLVELQSFDNVVPLSQEMNVHLQDLNLNVSVPRKRSSQMDMNWSFFESENSLSLNLVYNIDLYSANLAMQYAHHFEVLCSHVTANSSTNLTDCPLVSPTEDGLTALSGPTFDLPETPFIRHFQKIAQLHPEKIALQCGESVRTYRVLDENSNKIANFLIGRGLTNEALVCVLHERGIEFIEIVLGIFKAGCTYVPIDIQSPASRIIEILNDCASPCLIAESHLLSVDVQSQIKNSSVSTILATAALPFDNFDREIAVFYRATLTDNTPPTVPVSNHDLAYIIYTSGSTGKPKGVMIEQGGMLNHLLIKIHELDINEDSVIAQNASQSFDISVWQMLSALTQGGKVVIFPQGFVLDPVRFIGYLFETGVTILEVVPSYLRAFMDIIDEYKLSSAMNHVKHLLVTGEVFKASLANRCLHTLPHVQIVNAYGPTEASDDITHHFLSEKISEEVPIGSVLSNLQIMILDEHLNICPPYVKGEICVTGKGIGRGYLNDIDRTEKVFIQNPHPSPRTEKLYRTGDIGRYQTDGTLEFFGRKDAQVKVKGYRIELGEIESRLLALDEIESAAAKIFTDSQGENYIVAFVSGRLIRQEHEKSIVHQLKKILPDYLVPSQIVVLEHLPLTANGKTNYEALAQPAAKLVNTDYEAPASEVESFLVKAWEDLFLVRNIGVNTDFFDLGGDSIKAIQLVSKMHKYGYHVEIKDIFQNATISLLKNHVYLNGSENQGAIVGRVPLGPSQIEFFANHSQDIHHYNMAAMLEFYRDEEMEYLSEVFDKLYAHHDMLRATFSLDPHGQNVQTLLPPGHLQIQDHKVADEASLTELVNRLQGSFDLSSGPLIKVVKLNYSNRRLVLIIIHHLIFDGVSWRILLEDLASLIQQKLDGQALFLGAKTRSYQQWHEKLVEKVQTEEFTAQMKYWEAIDREIVAVIPLEKENADQRVVNSATQSFTVDLQKFQTVTSRNLKADMLDILLAAISSSIQKQFGINDIAIMLETHAREIGMKNVNISRTIGWFSADYPVVFHLHESADWDHHLRTIKDTMHAVPENGLGYALIKYAAERSDTQTHALKPQIRFNYMGQFDAEADNGIFRLSSESVGEIHSGSGLREFAFEISATIVNMDLSLTVSYNSLNYTSSTVKQLISVIESNMESILLFVGADQEDAFTFDGISGDELDHIKNLFN